MAIRNGLPLGFIRVFWLVLLSDAAVANRIRSQNRLGINPQHETAA